LESIARRQLTLAEYQCLDVIAIELMRHGGKYAESGGIPIEYETFIKFGVHKDAVAPALRGLEALGFIRVTKRGRGGNASYRLTAEYCPTFLKARDHVNNEARPTDEWREWESKPGDIGQAAKEARNRKDPRAVAKGKRHYRPRRKHDPKKIENAILNIAGLNELARPIVGDNFSALIIDEDEEIRLRGVVQ